MAASSRAPRCPSSRASGSLRRSLLPEGGNERVGNVETAFVLGGGGVLGAHEVGMLQALDEAGIRPDLVVGTSVGALNGAVIAAAPDEAVARLTGLWRSDIVRTAFAGSWVARLSTLARTGTHLHPMGPLRDVLGETVRVSRIEDLTVPFQCVAASVERAAARWFTSGPLVEAVLASCAVPGLLPPVVIGGEHFYDGGLVHSIPVGRAVQLGAKRVYVLHVGRIERPLSPPRRFWEVGMVAFEIARRHRFAEDMASLPPGVEVHVLPAGMTEPLSPMRYRDLSQISACIERAYQASSRYLGNGGG
ncbi:patatin-like phospholipase family protein [Nonomuraea turkmeniaca]|uniref:Patatin-like phospholipase family protein n=1 Tax=Nonomuraea turkmeniaca TaxID=103838 RepID=A0A5S4F8Y9_9ACTN|nr:patatin-like phospholipase family protein [Nonomuraea turkmeniaca]